jgi:hypothetical protein
MIDVMNNKIIGIFIADSLSIYVWDKTNNIHNSRLSKLVYLSSILLNTGLF